MNSSSQLGLNLCSFSVRIIVSYMAQESHCIQFINCRPNTRATASLFVGFVCVCVLNQTNGITNCERVMRWAPTQSE